MPPSRARGIAWRLACALLLCWKLEGAETPELTRAIDLRSLAPQQAAQGLPVTLRGVVIFIEPTLVFIQDETAGAYFRVEDRGALRVGDEVEVKGRTNLGIYLPEIERASYRILARGKLPRAVDVNYDDLVAGGYHYERVAVEGVVRSLTALSEGRSQLRLAFYSRVFDIWVEAPPENQTLVGSLVRVSGLAVGTVNSRRQLVQPYMRTMGWSEIEIIKPAQPDDEVPRAAAADLLTSRLGGQGASRVRIAGTVTASLPRGMLYLRNENTALGARLAHPARVQVGDQVEVIGFPAMNRLSASLMDAKLVKRAAGTTPAAVRVTSEDLFRGDHDGDLVALTAIVSDSYPTDRERVLVLEDNERRVRVRGLDRTVRLPVGGRVQVTGIARVEVSEEIGYNSQPEAIAITVRSAADVILLSSPSWWTVRRLSLFLAVLGGAMLLAALWIALLRRQVRRQAALSRSRIESEAALEERQRLAREFHDTLEQELVGLGLRLDAVATRALDDKGRTLVEASRSLVSRIQSETRNLVSDLRDPPGLALDLVAALNDLADLRSMDGQAEVRVEVAAAVPRLTVGGVHNLRMIARESVTNALKHSGATLIVVRLEFTVEGQLRLTISDNGRGFDVAQETCGKRGHFGCVGMRERCAKLGAQITWRSAPGQGATVEVSLPAPRATGDSGRADTSMAVAAEHGVG